MLPLQKTGGQQVYRRFKARVLKMQPLRSVHDFIIQYLFLNLVVPEDAASRLKGAFYHSGEHFCKDIAAHGQYTSVCINNGFNKDAAETLERHIFNLEKSTGISTLNISARNSW